MNIDTDGILIWDVWHYGKEIQEAIKGQVIEEAEEIMGIKWHYLNLKQNKTLWEEWHEYNDKDKSDFPLDYRTWLERKVESERSRHEEERRKWMDELLDVKEKYADECSRHEKELKEKITKCGGEDTWIQKRDVIFIIKRVFGEKKSKL
jgi:hypothetical protein